MRDPLARLSSAPDDLDRLMRAAFKLLEAEHGDVILDAAIGRALGFTTRVDRGQGFWHAGVRLNTGRINWQRLPMWTSHLPSCTDFEAQVLDWAEARQRRNDVLSVFRCAGGRWTALLSVTDNARLVEGSCIGAYTEPLARMGATLNLVAKLQGWWPRPFVPSQTTIAPASEADSRRLAS